jgi:hypothetical protein
MTKPMNVRSVLFGIGLSAGTAEGEFGQGVKAEGGIEDVGEVSFV